MIRTRWLGLAVILGVALCGALPAADIVWSGAGGSNWNTPGNWVGGSIPGVNDRAVFDGSGVLPGSISGVSGSVGGIRVSSTSPITVTLVLSNDFVITGQVPDSSVRLDGSNALAITSGLNKTTFLTARIRVGNGSLSVSGDVELGDSAAQSWVDFDQINGNISFGDTTVPQVIGAGSNDNVNVNFKRSPGGIGTITLGSLTIEGDTNDDFPASNERNAPEVNFNDVSVTCTGLVSVNDGTGGSGDEGDGAVLRIEDSMFTADAGMVVGNGASTQLDSGVEANFNNSTLRIGGAGNSIDVGPRALFFFFQGTLTSSVGAWSFLADDLCDSVLFLEAVVSARAAGELTFQAGAAGGNFFGLMFVDCDFSNYDANGVQIRAGAVLGSLEECTFQNGQSGGTHLQFSGLDGSSTPTASMNAFDISTGAGANSFVQVNSATNLVFLRGGSGSFGIGATVDAAAAEARDDDGTTPGSDVLWQDGFNLATLAYVSQAGGLRADTTANQAAMLFSVNGTSGSTMVSNVSFEAEWDDYNSSGFSSADIASITLFHDANANDQFDAGEALDTTTTITSSFSFNPARTVNQGVTEQWGLALTFGGTVAGKSGRASIFCLPGMWVAAGSIFQGYPLVTMEELNIAGAPDHLDSWNSIYDATAGAAFLGQAKIVVVDVNGQRVTWDSSTVIMPSIQTDPVGGSSLIGADAAGITAVKGVAEFTNLGIDTPGNGFMIRFTASPALASSSILDSNTFDVENGPPEMDVLRSATAVSDGGSDAVGSLSLASPITLTYTIENNGSGNLSLTGGGSLVALSSAVNCAPAVTTPPASPVAPSGSTTFIITVNVTVPGAFSFDVSIANDDADENPYNFSVSGTGSGPDIELRRSAAIIADGGADSVTGAVAGSPLVLTYTIVNTGNATLTLTGGTPVTASPGTTGNCSASATAQPGSGTVSGGGGSTTFQVTVTPTAAGAFDFDVYVASDDPDESPYHILGSGSATAAPEPEIDISRGGSSIVDGGADALGSILAGSATGFVYTIENLGSATLTLTGGTPVAVSSESNCSVSITQPGSSTVAASGSTTFTLDITPTTAGAFSFDLTIGSDDTDEATYNIAVSGAGSATAPDIDLQRPASTSIADGGSDALGNRTIGAAFTLTYTIANTGTSDLTLTGGTPVSISGTLNCTAAVTTQPSSGTIAASNSTTFVVTVTPTAAGAFSFDLAVASDDPNENPYDIAVSGTGTAATTSGGSSGGGGGGGCVSGAASHGWPVLLLLAILAAPWARLARRKRA